LDPLRHIKNPRFGAVFFRQTFRQIRQEGGMWDESSGIYPYLGGIPKLNHMEWGFPSGARISFAYLQSESDKYNYDGAQIPLIGFDQLEHFSETQFFYMLARNRSTCGIRPYIRATCNPDADSWLAKFLAWWIDQETGYAIPERGGVIRYFLRVDNQTIWADDLETLKRSHPKLMPKSFTFIPASVYDNKILLRLNPEYLGNLMALDQIEKERLLRGNWKIRAAAGKLYNREWYAILPASPPGGIVVRYWDFAATAKEINKPDPDFTAGTRIRFVDGSYYIEHSTWFQDSPLNSEKRFINITVQDWYEAKQKGFQYKCRWELEGGAAARRDAARLIKALTAKCPGIDARGLSVRDDKVTRGREFSAQSEAGNIYLIKGPWNEEYLNHMHNQPEAAHDDIADSSTGAFNTLNNRGWSQGMG
jgi:predicted phage terminase large subunit-like protein